GHGPWNGGRKGPAGDARACRATRGRDRSVRCREDHGIHPPSRLRRPRPAALGPDGRPAGRTTSRHPVETRNPQPGNLAVHESPILRPLPSGGVGATEEPEIARASLVRAVTSEASSRSRTMPSREGAFDPAPCARRSLLHYGRAREPPDPRDPFHLPRSPHLWTDRTAGWPFRRRTPAHGETEPGRLDRASYPRSYQRSRWRTCRRQDCEVLPLVRHAK